jgi:hypothetical protein
MNQGTTIHLDAERRVDVGVTGDDRFAVSVRTPASHTTLLGLSESDLRRLSKFFGQMVDCHSSVSEPSPRAARDRVSQVPGYVTIRVRYYDAIDRTVTLPLSPYEGWRVEPCGANREALLFRGGFKAWLQADLGDGGPTFAGMHQEAQTLLDQIARSSDDAGMFGYGEKYIAWRAE